MKRQMTMTLESLPNEILLDLFGYFDGINLLRTFYGLNSRFSLLLHKQFRAYYFFFPSISKHDFDMICQRHLPFIIDRVVTLNLGHFPDTPGQINLFFSYIQSITQFTHLRSLTLVRLRSYQILINIVDDCHHLCNLTHLYLYSCNCPTDKADLQLIVNNIWSLPKLTHCHFDVSVDRWEYFCLPTIPSTSLKDLKIPECALEYNQIHLLFEYTNHLKRLTISIESYTNQDYQGSLLPMLIDLDIRAYCAFDPLKLILFLENVPNLRHLNVYLLSKLITGYQWEQLIRHYLPKLKIFQLSMTDKHPIGPNIQEQADEVLNSFRSPFWIDEHQWFVRCAISDRTIHLQTLSGTSCHLEKNFPDWWKSTCPDDDREKFFNTMCNISYETFFDQPIPSYLRLQNITHLRIKLPISDNLWHVVTNLDQLESLSVSFHDDSFQSQLQTLLDRAPKLRNVSISQNFSLPLQTSLFQYTSTSVRELHLRKYNHHFNEEECMALTRSSLGVQCEILSIAVTNRESIVILVQNMISLHALHVECENENVPSHQSLTRNDNGSCDKNTAKKDEIIQWLKDRLPSMYYIIKSPNSAITRIRIWIK